MSRPVSMRMATQQIGANPVLNFTHDSNGNMTSDGTNAYTWDRANRLLSMGGATYTYDGNGNRRSQTISSVATKYLLDTQPGLAKVLAETTNWRAWSTDDILWTTSIIELSDNYDWCFGTDTCDSSDTHPFEMRVGEFFALERSGRAKQFNYYWYQRIINAFKVSSDGSALTLLDSSSETFPYSAYEAQKGGISIPVKTYPPEPLDNDDWDPSWDPA